MFTTLPSLFKRFNELGIGDQVDFDKYYMYSLITHSTAIEGSTVTEIENRLLFDEGLTAKGRTLLEVSMNLDLKNAYVFAKKEALSHTDYSVDFLKKLSSLVMKSSGGVFNTALGSFDSSKGDLRLVNVTAGYGGKSYMNYSKVPDKLKLFCLWLNSERKSLDKSDVLSAYKLSVEAHYRLVAIHPWVDGNGRMARLVMNMLQYEFGLVPIRVQKERRVEYITSLDEAQKQEESANFIDFMLSLQTDNLKEMIAQYEKSMDSEGPSFTENVPLNVPLNLTERQTAIIGLIRDNSSITLAEIATSLAVTEKTIKRDIDTLKQARKITRVGSRKSGKWIVND